MNQLMQRITSAFEDMEETAKEGRLPQVQRLSPGVEASRLNFKETTLHFFT